MAVAYDTAQTPTTGGTSGATDPWVAPDFTPAAGANRQAIVFVGLGDSGGNGTVTSVTLGGQAMTQVGTAASDGNWTSLTAWALNEAGIAAMSGAALSIDWAVADLKAAVGFTVTGAAQSSAFASIQTGGGTGTTAQASSSVTSTATGLVVAGVMSDAEGGITASHSDDSGQLKGAVLGADTIIGAQYTAGTGGALNLSWGQASTGYAVIAFNINAVAGVADLSVGVGTIGEPVIGGSLF